MTYREYFEQMTVKEFFDKSVIKFEAGHYDAFEDFICENLDCDECIGKYRCDKDEWLEKEREQCTK